jgi:hypothetical protein
VDPASAAAYAQGASDLTGLYLQPY